ncbi:LOW QUALITY PROTEIN: uncharacterized protein [Amphiura filiformis]|uniref:LOW QUALITY PROTEIN: uncharacterized protein n=1 Tax=Amphiura filiformis TaxID=82378 RepID=UPI003B21B506
MEEYLPEHLMHVDRERDVYRQMVEDAKAAIDPHETLGHFDFAQQVHFPSDPQQAGPIYFMCPRKCGIFGVCCEAVPQQVTYFIDEGMAVSKGSNSVISDVHDFFRMQGFGETTVHLHCDNCSGQNKNKYALWYLAWRTIHKLHTAIHLHFLIAGHTEFAPDWCFGLLKKSYKNWHVNCLEDLVEMCHASSTMGVNKPCLVGTENGDVLVPTYDWQEFLSDYFNPLTGIKSLHHIKFSADHPGCAFYREFAESDEKMVQLLKDVNRLPPPPEAMPDPMPAPGLSAAHQSYLYKQIHPFYSAAKRDVTCPQPADVAEIVD